MKGYIMDKKEFNNLLKRAKLSKKEFAELVGVLPSSVNNWGGSQNVPYWVESWLINYIKAGNFDKIGEMFKSLDIDA